MYGAFTMLNVQHRMHPELSRFPSLCFYDGKLKDGVSSNQRSQSQAIRWVNPAIPSCLFT